MAFDNFSKISTSGSSPKADEAKLHQMIRERAHYIWERKGKPTGQDLAIWLKAEKEIRVRFK